MYWVLKEYFRNVKEAAQFSRYYTIFPILRQLTIFPLRFFFNFAEICEILQMFSATSFRFTTTYGQETWNVNLCATTTDFFMDTAATMT
jgi:hypothetical protein